MKRLTACKVVIHAADRDLFETNIRAVVFGVCLILIIGTEGDRKAVVPCKFGQAAVVIRRLAADRIGICVRLRFSVELGDRIFVVVMRRDRHDGQHVTFLLQADIRIFVVKVRARKIRLYPSICIIIADAFDIGKIVDRFPVEILAPIRRHAVIVPITDIDRRPVITCGNDMNFKIIIGVRCRSHRKGKMPLPFGVAGSILTQKRKIQLDVILEHAFERCRIARAALDGEPRYVIAVAFGRARVQLAGSNIDPLAADQLVGKEIVADIDGIGNRVPDRRAPLDRRIGKGVCAVFRKRCFIAGDRDLRTVFGQSYA